MGQEGESPLPAQGPIGQCVSCLLNLVRFGQSIVLLWGIILVLNTPKATCSDCENLYNIAWWTYIGMLSIGLILGCCILPTIFCCGVGGMAMLTSQNQLEQAGVGTAESQYSPVGVQYSPAGAELQYSPAGTTKPN